MMQILKKIYRKFKNVYYRIRCKLSSDYAYWHGVKQWYYNWVQKELNYNHPVNMSEKLMWLTRYWQNPLKSECADKYLVRQYIKNNGFEDILLPIYGVWKNPEDIDFDKLPNQFVVKCNHGCGYNIICKDKSQLDKQQTIDTLKMWLQEDFGALYHEIHYSKIKPLVYCEKFLPSLESSVIDYKLHCINGNPYCFLLCSERDEVHHKLRLSSYSLKWERLNLLKHEAERTIAKPRNLDRMIKIATALSKPFPYVRVDFYEIEEKLYFGELTFTPQGNVMDYYKDEVLLDMGNKLQLPEKYKG